MQQKSVKITEGPVCQEENFRRSFREKDKDDLLPHVFLRLNLFRFSLPLNIGTLACEKNAGNFLSKLWNLREWEFTPKLSELSLLVSLRFEWLSSGFSTGFTLLAEGAMEYSSSRSWTQDEWFEEVFPATSAFDFYFRNFVKVSKFVLKSWRIPEKAVSRKQHNGSSKRK